MGHGLLSAATVTRWVKLTFKLASNSRCIILVYYSGVYRGGAGGVGFACVKGRARPRLNDLLRAALKTFISSSEVQRAKVNLKLKSNLSTQQPLSKETITSVWW